jgi:hypothetical protein
MVSAALPPIQMKGEQQVLLEKSAGYGFNQKQFLPLMNTENTEFRVFGTW